MRRCLVFLALLFCLTPALADAAVAPRPVVSGNTLIDSATGKTYVPRGVDWPGFEYACVDGYGYARDDRGPRAIQKIADWHATAVRIPLNQDCWMGDDGLPAGAGQTAAGYRDAVADFVDAVNAAGMIAILDLHWSAPTGTKADGQRAMPDARSSDFWFSVAAHFAGNPSVLYDVFNEPYSRYDLNPDGTTYTTTFDLTWNCWKSGGAACGAGAPLISDQVSVFDGKRYTPSGMQTMVDAVRSAGARQPILLSGIDYANDLRGWLNAKPTDTQLVASIHNYLKQRCNTATCWDAEIAPVAAVVPVVAAEFGEDDCKSTFDTAFMNWADQHGVGYLGWSWTIGPAACSDYSLISDDQGTPRAPNGTALHQRLADIAAHGEPARAAATPTPTPAPTATAKATPTPDPATGGVSSTNSVGQVPTPTLSELTVKPRVLLGLSKRSGRKLTIRGTLSPAAALKVSLALVIRKPGAKKDTTIKASAKANQKTGAVTIKLTLPSAKTKLRRGTLAAKGYATARLSASAVR